MLQRSTVASPAPVASLMPVTRAYSSRSSGRQGPTVHIKLAGWRSTPVTKPLPVPLFTVDSKRRTAPYWTRLAVPQAVNDSEKQQSAAGATSQDDSPSDSTSLLSSVGLFVLWAGLAAYAFFVAPNQTPLRDSYFLEKLIGLGSDDGVPINSIVQSLFLVMGVWPLVYTALLIPSGKSNNGVPIWPFVSLSYGVGAFALLPFMALWQPPKDPPQVPAAAEDLQGTGNLMQKGMESPVVAFLCLAGALYCTYQAATAGVPQWNAYFKLLEESRFINVMTCDFLALTALAPFWMSNDAALRKWDQRDSLLPVLSLIPLFGPCIYLCLRPRTKL